MYKIVIDSCGELSDALKQDEHFCNVPLELDVDGFKIRDDETFNQLDFLRRVKESVAGPQSACPSPEAYMEAFKGDAENIYVVTLSGKLSGSYNSAVLAANLYNEEHEDVPYYCCGAVIAARFCSDSVASVIGQYVVRHVMVMCHNRIFFETQIIVLRIEIFLANLMIFNKKTKKLHKNLKKNALILTFC